MTDKTLPEPFGYVTPTGIFYYMTRVGKDRQPVFTADQLHAALAAQAEEHAAERDALRAEVEALRAAMGQIITMAERGLGLDPSSMDNYFVWIQDKARASIDAASTGGGKC